MTTKTSVKTTGNIHTAPRCNQCQELRINGVRCHEHGCPNARKTYDHEREQWVQYYTCAECGYDLLEHGDVCNCQVEEGGGND